MSNKLLDIEMPGRYVGGEYGSRCLNFTPRLRIAICFPDLYEIGMSNQTIKLLYNLLNQIPGVYCERVFAPADDFRALLKNENKTLFTLETGTPILEMDILAFTVGYELSATNILNVLDAGGISVQKQNRTSKEPIVVAGGTGLTNPKPFADIFDAVFIGEAEKEFSDLIQKLADCKADGFSRKEIIDLIISSKHIWHSGKKEPTSRAIWSDFGKKSIQWKYLPVPNVSVVQDHGVIEVMRGCPNGCRFCHAGFFYRPMRCKDFTGIIEESDYLINEAGYREITLSSLSTGDYQSIYELMQILNSRYKDKHISFSLPSLRLNSFTISLLEEVSSVRKSGLTFAIETADKKWQHAINKDISKEKILEIIEDAKKRGWKLAKFYFMIGLPVADEMQEAERIVEYLLDIKAKTKIKINTNIGTFVPKPHTPYQWDKQLTLEQSKSALQYIKNTLKGSGIKVNYHEPFQSYLEGIISRGDEKVSGIIIKAFENGASFDAWEDKLNKPVWQDVLAGENAQEYINERDVEQMLPWDDIDLGVTKKYLIKEKQKSMKGEL
ncbi:MAG: radical SAM protein, partial [Spirochaetia bacterium]